MDIRKQKTRQAIQNAFLQLRKEKNLEQISVTELSRLAQISKATFYLHYRDVFDLSEKLQNEVIGRILDRIGIVSSVQDNWSEFMKRMMTAIEEDNSLIVVLFSGSQLTMYPLLLEDQLRERIRKESPELKEDTELSIRLTYHIQGGYHAYLRHAKHTDLQHVLDVIGEIYSR